MFGICHLCFSIVPVAKNNFDALALGGHRVPHRPKSERCPGKGLVTPEVAPRHRDLRHRANLMRLDHECFEDEGIASPYDSDLYTMGIFKGYGEHEETDESIDRRELEELDAL